MAQLDHNECAVLLQFLRTCEVTIRGDLIPVVASSMHKMEATVIAAQKEHEKKSIEKESGKADSPFA